MTTPIKKMIVSSSAFFGLAAIIVFLFVFPLLRDIKKHSEIIISKNKEIISFKEELGQSENFKILQDNLNSGAKKIDTAFVDLNTPIEAIRFWDKSAKNCGLSIEISPVLSAAEGDYYGWKSLAFKIGLEGAGFPEILRFVEKIESGPFFLQINEFSSSKLENGMSAVLTAIIFSNEQTD